MVSTSLEAQLAHFHGSTTRTRHALVPSVQMAEGVVFLAEAAGAHWLTDAIASYVHDARAREEEFQVWQLVVDGSLHTGLLTMCDGNSTIPIITQELDYSKRGPAALLPACTGIVVSPSKLWGIEPVLWSTLLTTRRLARIAGWRS